MENLKGEERNPVMGKMCDVFPNISLIAY